MHAGITTIVPALTITGSTLPLGYGGPWSYTGRDQQGPERPSDAPEVTKPGATAIVVFRGPQLCPQRPLAGESQGGGSLVGCRLWGHTESDTTEAT